MLIPFNEVVSNYWEIVKDNYPDVDADHFSLICRTPFKFIRKQMARLEIPIIMIKGLGKFVVFPVSIRARLKGLELAKTEGTITEEVYTKAKEDLKSKLLYIEKLKHRRKRY